MTCQKLERGGSDFIFHIYIAHTYLDVFQNKKLTSPFICILHTFTRIFTHRLPGECEKETFIAQSKVRYLLLLKELEIQMGSKLCFVPFFTTKYISFDFVT